MVQLVRILYILEILFVNLLTTHICSRKKYKLSRVVGELVLFTVLLFFLSIVLRENIQANNLSETILLLISCAYFFPLKHLYDETGTRIFAIMSFSWIHTISVTFLSLEITGLLFKKQSMWFLFTATVFFLFSTPVFIHFAKNQFLYILRNIPSMMRKYLVYLGVAEATTLAAIFLFYREVGTSFWRIAIILLITSIAIIGYNLLFIIVKNFISITDLERLAYCDTLTGIKNRLALVIDCEKLISENKSFAFIFIDLDNFKSINDMYGHSIGDEYLKLFTQSTIEAIGDKDSLYRLSGDEFICLYQGAHIDVLIEEIIKKNNKTVTPDIPFYGFSIGYAKFPEDGDKFDTLIKKADAVMYEEKENKKQKRVCSCNCRC